MDPNQRGFRLRLRVAVGLRLVDNVWMIWTGGQWEFGVDAWKLRIF